MNGAVSGIRYQVSGGAWDSAGIVVVLVLNFLLSMGYGVVNPLFEAPDEHHHYFTAQWMAENGRLPAVPQPAEERFFVPQRPSDWLGQEAAQPPLYYMLAALFIAPFETENARELTVHNPFARLGDPSARVNVNAFAHGHDGWPWRGHVLAAHLLRMLSAVMGVGVVWLIYKSGRLLWPDRPQRALIAAGFVAFLPQFTFQFGSISNDVLVTLLATWALYQLLLVSGVRCQVSGGVVWWRWVLLGVTVGLTALTKNQGVVLLVFVVGFVIAKGVRCQVSGVRCPSLLSTLYSLLLIVLPALVLAVPLWVRNWRLYGDFTAANQFVALAGGDRGYTVWQALGEWRAIWFSFFANFGWFNVALPEGVYWFWLGLVIFAAAGAVLSLTQRRKGAKVEREEREKGTRGEGNKEELLATRHLLPATNFVFTIRFLTSTPVLLFGWFLAVLVALLAFNMRTPAAQGRLLFPALLPIGLGMGYGLAYFTEKADFRLFSFFLFTVGMNLFGLFFVLRPVYALPEVVAQVPEAATEYGSALGERVTLVAAEVQTTESHPGQFVELVLYWRKEGTLTERPEVVIELFGRKQQLVGKVQSWHGRGLYPADFWPQGELLVERTYVQIDRLNVDGEINSFPTLATINVKLAGQEAVQDIGVVEVEPYSYSALSEEVEAQFGEQIELVSVRVVEDGVAAGEVVTVRPVWQVRGDVDQNYAVFVQLGEQGVPPLAQGDSIPLNGTYPTNYWKADQVLRDEYEVVIPAELPDGEYPLYIGLYTPEPPYERLPLFVNGNRRPFDALLVDIIEIVGGTGR